MAKLNPHLPSERCAAETVSYTGGWPNYNRCNNFGKFDIAVKSARNGEDPHTVKVCGNHKRVLVRGSLMAEVTGPKDTTWPYDYPSRTVVLDKTKGDADEQAQPARENAAPGGNEAL